MAKAQFHKNQRVFVRPVGTWAQIEKVMPQWTKGLDEPLRIFYDVGLGRDFTAEELEAEQGMSLVMADMPTETWRILRARNKWQSADDSSHHPFPGTHPVVVTSEKDWGGWRVPGAEYDYDPNRIEAQARLIASAPKLMAVTKALVDYAESQAENFSNELLSLAKDASEVLKRVQDDQAR